MGLDYDQLFPGRFLKAGEFGGKDVTLTVSAIELEELPQDKGGDRTRGIISFERTKKKLVLNRTNGECLKAMFGRDTGAWIGKRVTLYPMPYDGDFAIRVKGSPDLKEPLEFEMKLPRKRPVKKLLVPTGKANGTAAAPAPAAQPEAEDAPPEDHWNAVDGEQP